MQKKYLFLFGGLLFFFLIGTEIATAQLSGYTNRLKGQINASQVEGTSDLTNFPVLVSFALNDLRTTGNGGFVQDAQGDDITFTAANGTTILSHQRESYNPATGALEFWVRFPTVSATVDTEFYVYFGNPSITSDQSSTNVWDSNYKLVLHLDETAPGPINFTDAAGEVLTSDISDNATTTTTGQIGGARLFTDPGTGDLITVADNGVSPLDISGNITISLWVQITNLTSGPDILSKGDYTDGYGVWVDGSGSLRFQINNTSLNSPDGAIQQDGNWDHIAFTRASNGDRIIYANGQQIAEDNNLASFTVDDDDLFLSTAAFDYEGGMDEVRISNITRDSAWIATEYNNQSSPGTFFTQLNSEPILADIEAGTITYNSGDSPTVITSAITLFDGDDTNIEGATISITSNFDSSEDVLSFVDANGITGSYAAGSGILTLTGTSSIANYQAALRSITYENTDPTPTESIRTISITINDGDDDSNIETRNINVVKVNIAPVLSGLESGSIVYFAGNGQKNISSSILVSDADDTNIEGATISITSGFNSSEDVLAFVDANGITGSYAGGTGILTLSGSVSKATYQAALRTVTYQNTAGSPDMTTRTISITVNDGTENSVTVTRNVEFPADITELATYKAVGVFHFDAQDADGDGNSGTNQPANGTLTTWGDRSDNVGASAVNIVATASGGDTPTLDDSYFGGRSGIFFDYNSGNGGDTYPITDNAILNTSAFTEKSFAAVFRTGSSVSGLQIIYEQGGGSNGYQISIKDGNAYAFAWSVNGEWVDGDDQSINLGPVETNTTYIVIASHDQSTTTWEANINGGSISQSSGAAGTMNSHGGDANIGEEDGTVDPVTFGNNPTTTNNFDGFVGELISWNNALTTTDFTNIYGFLSDKWFNTPSVLSSIEISDLSYNEGDPATDITDTIVLTDVDTEDDATEIDSAKVSITSGFESSEDVLDYVTALGITGSYDSGTGVLTLTGSTTTANYQTALRNVTYQNTETTSPSTATREISFVVYDWDDESGVVTREIDIIPSNDIPTLSITDVSTISFTEDDSPVQTTSDLTVADNDDTDLQGATVAFINNYFLGEDILNYSDANGIIGTFNSTTGVLTLSGTTTLANYQTALRSVTYENISSDPVTGLDRTIEFRVFDGIDSSATGITRPISVSSLNTAPTLGSVEVSNLFYPSGDTIAVTETITLNDPDNTNIESVTFQITTNYDSSEDTLIFEPIFGITPAWTLGSGTLTLTGPAPKADFESALRTVKYASRVTTPTDIPRTVEIQANDNEASNNLSNIVTRNISFSIPKSVDDLLFWLKGDAGTFDATSGGSASTDGGVVRRWEDQSGNNRNFTTSGTAPLFQTNEATINSQNAIEFDGSSGMRLEDDDAENYLNGLDGLTIFFVIESDDINTDQGFWTTTTPSGSDDTFTIRYDDTGDNGGGDNVIKTGMRDLPVAFAQESFEDAQTTTGQIVMLKWTSEVNYELYVDGVLSNPTFFQNIPTGVLTDVTTAIIGQGEQDASGSWDGLIAEVILYGTEISINDQEAVEDYLSTKYGIAIRSLTAATGGEAISADDASIAPSPAYTTLTGPRVQESFAGEFANGGTFIFNAPTGFEWDPTSGSATTNAAFGGTTLLSISSTPTSSSSSQLTFTISAASTTNPGEIVFSNFRVRPTTGDLPNTGNITNTGTTGLGGSTSYGTLTMVAGTQIEMEFVADPPTSNVSSSISPAVRVQLIDQFGNPVEESRVNISVALNQVSGSGVLSGTTTKQTNLFGIAEFTDLSVDDVGTYTFTASSSGLADTTSNEFDVVILGQLTQFTVTRTPSGNIANKLAGQNFNIDIIARDGAQDTVDTFTGTVVISSNCTLGTGAGTSANFVGGVLSSKTVSISSLGTCTITATNSAGSETGTSNTFDVTPGAASVSTTTISASPSVILNDGFSTSTITVQLKDSEGNNRTVGGETIVLSTTDGSLSSVTDNGNGTYTATLTSSVIAGTATITGTLNAVAISDNAQVEFAEFNNIWRSSVGSVAAARNWDLATNWSAGTVPVPADKVLIPANPSVGNEQPVVNTTNTTVLQLSIESGASVTVSGGKELIVTGELSGDGEVLGSNTDSVTVGGNLAISDMSVGYVTLDGIVNQDVTTPNDYVFLILDNTQGADFFSNLTVSDSLKLINGTLFMPSGTNLIANAKEYVNGNIRMQRTITGTQGWRILSSPIDTTFTEFLDGVLTQGYSGAFYSTGSNPGDTLQPNVLTYIESYPGTDNQRYRSPDSYSDGTISSNGKVPAGKGMFLYSFGNIVGDSRYNDPLPDTLDVIGLEFEGDGTEVDFGITYTTAADSGWNLIGNPFLATIDWDDAANWTKTNVESTIYIWDPASNGGEGEYLTWNGVTGTLPTGGLIAPFQGFWVKANAASPELKVNLDAKTTSGGFLRKEAPNLHSDSTSVEQQEKVENERDVVQIALAVTSEQGRSKKTNIMFSDEGAVGKDNLDGYRLLPLSFSHIEFHSLLEDGSELAINNLPKDFNSRQFIPLHIDAFEDGVPVSGEYTVVWDQLRTVPEDWIITLTDNDTGTEINLLEELSYTFNHSTKAKISRSNSPLTPNYSIRKKSKNRGTRFTLKISTEQIERDVPEEIFLDQNYPNPFNPSTTIPFGLNETSNVELVVYDILGRKVQTLVNSSMNPGRYDIRFNAGPLASGVYFYRLVTDTKVMVKRFTLIK
ncbi:MAG: DUF2341 domain-containing protein [Balneolaceae bacterium]|nr:DUF2341 domain-containing protein [Balneolaceae bacterium]MBO6647829.1 DUF2341 domain-containing protein [Balneolaceae bacterium]